MLPEDATRYILNNEKAFFNEFSERASAVGLSDTQIAEAFEAMKNGDYAKMATCFDASSPVDGAVFWSGNKEGAAAYANSIGGTIMEQSPPKIWRFSSAHFYRKVISEINNLWYNILEATGGISGS